MATTNDRTIEANGVATVTAPAEGAKVMLLSPSGVLTPVTMERLAELVRGTLQVGGRNYVRNSQTVVKALHATNNYNYSILDSTLKDVKAGESFTVSCDDFETEGDSFDKFEVKITTPAPNFKNLASFKLSRESKSSTTIISEDASKVNILMYTGISGDTANKGITVSHLKVERGNVATDWTPAPEDIADLLTENRGGVNFTLPICYALRPLFSEEKGGLQHERQDSYSDQRNSKESADGCGGLSQPSQIDGCDHSVGNILDLGRECNRCANRVLQIRSTLGVRCVNVQSTNLYSTHAKRRPRFLRSCILQREMDSLARIRWCLDRVARRKEVVAA